MVKKMESVYSHGPSRPSYNGDENGNFTDKYDWTSPMGANKKPSFTTFLTHLQNLFPQITLKL
jgi:hypothetical protein